MQPLSTLDRPKRRGRGLLVLLAVVLLLGAAAAGVLALRTADVGLETTGPPDGETLGAPDVDDLEFRYSADQPDLLAEAVLLLDDEDVTAQAEWDGDDLVYRPDGLPDGSHTLELRIDRGFPNRSVRDSRDFVLDTTPPEITVTSPTEEVEWGEPAVLAGTVDKPGQLLANGEEVALDDDGAFEITYDPPPSNPVELDAVDELGNQSSESVEIEVAPREPPGMRSVHVTAHAWASDQLREPIMDMVRDGLINSIELDIKDEDGAVGYDSQVPLAQESGAAQGFYDLDEALAELRAHDVHVVGRIVAFADPILARHLWENGDRDKVIQTPDGEMYTGRYAGFTNFADADIRQYNIDLAEEAAEAGFDDILYDYVRRPDGSLDNMVIPGLEGTPEEGIVQFFAETREALNEHRAWLGASVYGIAADRPTQIGQDIPEIAQHVDYVAPMVYPSHWGPGEYGVENPNAQPYDIVHASLQLFQEAVEGTDARVVPWLQDFSLGHTYGPAEVRAQIQAAEDLGIEEFLLWNAGSRYTREALE